MFVSHDRYFIDKLATRVIEVWLTAPWHVFPGNYEEYLWRKNGGAEQPAEQPKRAVPTPVNHAANNARKAKAPDHHSQIDPRARQHRSR